MAERSLSLGKNDLRLEFVPVIFGNPGIDVYSPDADSAERYLTGQLSLKEITELWSFLEREFPNQRPKPKRQSSCRMSDTGQHEGTDKCIHCKVRLK